MSDGGAREFGRRSLGRIQAGHVAEEVPLQVKMPRGKTGSGPNRPYMRGECARRSIRREQSLDRCDAV